MASLSVALKRKTEQDTKYDKKKRKKSFSISGPDGMRPKNCPLSERMQLQLVMQLHTEQSNATPSPPSVKKTPSSSRKGDKINKRNDRGETPLHLATIKGDVTAIDSLLKQGADIDVSDYAGWTPLHEACNRGHRATVEFLLKSGANANPKGMGDEYPLHDAVCNKHHDVVKLLLKHGANPRLPNREGKRPLDLEMDDRMRKIFEDKYLKTKLAESTMFKRTPGKNKNLSPKKIKKIKSRCDDLLIEEDIYKSSNSSSSSSSCSTNHSTMVNNPRFPSSDSSKDGSTIDGDLSPHRYHSDDDDDLHLISDDDDDDMVSASPPAPPCRADKENNNRKTTSRIAHNNNNNNQQHQHQERNKHQRRLSFKSSDDSESNNYDYNSDCSLNSPESISNSPHYSTSSSDNQFERDLNCKRSDKSSNHRRDGGNNKTSVESSSKFSSSTHQSNHHNTATSSGSVDYINTSPLSTPTDVYDFSPGEEDSNKETTTVRLKSSDRRLHHPNEDSKLFSPNLLSPVSSHHSPIKKAAARKDFDDDCGYMIKSAVDRPPITPVNSIFKNMFQTNDVSPNDKKKMSKPNHHHNNHQLKSLSPHDRKHHHDRKRVLSSDSSSSSSTQHKNHHHHANNNTSSTSSYKQVSRLNGFSSDHSNRLHNNSVSDSTSSQHHQHLHEKTHYKLNGGTTKKKANDGNHHKYPPALIDEDDQPKLSKQAYMDSPLHHSAALPSKITKHEMEMTTVNNRNHHPPSSDHKSKEKLNKTSSDPSKSKPSSAMNSPKNFTVKGEVAARKLSSSSSTSSTTTKNSSDGGVAVKKTISLAESPLDFLLENDQKRLSEQQRFKMKKRKTSTQKRSVVASPNSPYHSAPKLIRLVDSSPWPPAHTRSPTTTTSSAEQAATKHPTTTTTAAAGGGGKRTARWPPATAASPLLLPSTTNAELLTSTTTSHRYSGGAADGESASSLRNNEPHNVPLHRFAPRDGNSPLLSHHHQGENYHQIRHHRLLMSYIKGEAITTTPDQPALKTSTHHQQPGMVQSTTVKKLSGDKTMVSTPSDQRSSVNPPTTAALTPSTTTMGGVGETPHVVANSSSSSSSNTEISSGQKATVVASGKFEVQQAADVDERSDENYHVNGGSQQHDSTQLNQHNDSSKFATRVYSISDDDDDNDVTCEAANKRAAQLEAAQREKEKNEYNKLLQEYLLQKHSKVDILTSRKKPRLPDYYSLATLITCSNSLCGNSYLDRAKIKHIVGEKRKRLHSVVSKAPDHFWKFLTFTGNYRLSGHANSELSIPLVSPPPHLDQSMQDLFTMHESVRTRLRIQHIVQREKLVLSCEQEIMRVHSRAAHTIHNQQIPFSACAYFLDEEMCDIPHINSLCGSTVTSSGAGGENNNASIRDRFNKRTFASWMEDVTEKFMKVKTTLLCRQRMEAAALLAVQRSEWSLKLKELMSNNGDEPLSSEQQRQIDHVNESCVPLVNIGDDFELLPQTPS